jgi:hypothetical protein
VVTFIANEGTARRNLNCSQFVVKICPTRRPGKHSVDLTGVAKLSYSANIAIFLKCSNRVTATRTNRLLLSYYPVSATGVLSSQSVLNELESGFTPASSRCDQIADEEVVIWKLSSSRYLLPCLRSAS